MNRLIINTLYENRYLLTEEISYNPTNGEQIWAAQDRTEKQKVIGYFHANGQVEWFNDTRNLATNDKRNNDTVELGKILKKENRQTEQIDLSTIPKVGISTDPKPVKQTSKSVLYLIGIIVLLGGMFLAYKFYANTEIAKVQNNEKSDPIPSISKTNRPSTVENKESQQQLIQARKLANELNRYKQIPHNEQVKLVNEAKETFTTLIHTPESTVFIDSLMPIYRWNGVQEQILHQKNGNEQAKKDAISWYKLAYALKPNADLQMRFEYLEKQSETPPKNANVVTKKREPQKPTRSGFIKL